MNVIVAAIVTLASTIPIAVAEENPPEARVEVHIAGAGHSSDVGFGSLWVVAGNQFDRIDLNDNVITHVPIGGFQNFYGGVAIGEGAVWVSDGRTMLYKIDPNREKVVREIVVTDFNGFDRPLGFGVGEGAIWALTDAKELRRYSTESGAEEAVISLPSRAMASLSPSASSGSPEPVGTNCIALILLSIRSLQLSKLARDLGL